MADSIVIARIGAPHGVRGEVRLKLFAADPAALQDYGPLRSRDGREFTVTAMRPASGASPDMLVVRLAGVADRTAAEALTNLDLMVDRGRLPPPGEDDFYQADLIGLAAMTADGARLGTIIAVPNYGAGDLLEIAPPQGQTLLVPFTRAIVPVVDIASGRVVIDPPEGLLD
jgi:16S rRNA processing protein RimM